MAPSKAKVGEFTLADLAQQFTFDPSQTFGYVSKYLQPGMIQMRMMLRNARRFTLDRDFVSLAVQATKDGVGEVAVRRFYAPLPFPTVWIEYDRTARYPANPGLEGFLCWRLDDSLPEDWYALPVGQRPDGGVSLRGFSHRILCQGRITSTPTEFWRNITAKTWGYGDDNKAMYYAALGAIARTDADPFFSGPLIQRKVGVDYLTSYIEQNAPEAGGDIPFLITALAMINRVPIKQTHVGVPRHGYQKRLRHIPYLDHQIVRIETGKTSAARVVEQALAPRTPIRHRRHEVRAHFRTYHKGTPDQREKFIKEHERGDATLGFITHGYDVTSSNGGINERDH